jgi:dihydroorotate dehydrogenase
MEFFYQSGAMGYGGEGYLWHKVRRYNFPDFPVVTKTITLNKKIGLPFAVIKWKDSVWNHVSLHNPGFPEWSKKYYRHGLILSVYGSDMEIQEMCDKCTNYNLKGIELNYSCPNVRSKNNRKMPNTKFPLYLKINCRQDPHQYDLDRIERVHINTIPKFFGGVSGEVAKKENWAFIKKFSGEGINIAGCSFNDTMDLKYIKYVLDCKAVGIGSVMLTNPELVERLKNEKGIAG